jgi:hypothetical protein
MDPIEEILRTSTEWEEVAIYPKESGSDGQDAKVSTWKAPARFYKIEAMPSQNSVGEPVQPFVLQTGSGDEMLDLAHRIAKAVSEGMLGIK